MKDGSLAARHHVTRGIAAAALSDPVRVGERDERAGGNLIAVAGGFAETFRGLLDAREGSAVCRGRCIAKRFKTQGQICTRTSQGVAFFQH